MRVRPTLFVPFILTAHILLAQPAVRFEEYFRDIGLRIDFYQTGDAKEETFTVDRMYKEPVWSGSTGDLVNPIEIGRYLVKVYDVASNRLIYSWSFDCIFGEYKTTSPALKGVQRTFNRSFHIPFPKRQALVAIEVRDSTHHPHPLTMFEINPTDFHIITESTDNHDIVLRPLVNGDPHDKADLVFVGEGYTEAEKDKFRDDVDRFTGYLFDTEPFASHKRDFNIYGILRPSAESGVDEPRNGSFRKTTLGASFDAFDLDRYLLMDEGKRLREIAAQVPYDAIVILANSKRYGGGGIYNDYCISTVDNPASRMVFVHEFGHAFAGLADEYYSSDVAYNDFYPKGIEPLEPNITALLNPAEVKWKDLLSPGIEIPTPYGKDVIDSLQAEIARNNKAMNAALEEERKSGGSEREKTDLQDRYKARGKELSRAMDSVRAQFKSLEDKVGAFEGAGYTTKGLYRPMMYCLMIRHPRNEFCRVCQEAIKKAIGYYTGAK